MMPLSPMKVLTKYCPMGKSEDVYARNRTVADWIAKGYSRQTIHRLLETTFDVTSPATRRNIMREVREQYLSDEPAEALRFQNHERLDAIIELSMGKQDYKLAIDAIDKQNKLGGVYSEKREHTIDTDNIIINFKE